MVWPHFGFGVAIGNFGSTVRTTRGVVRWPQGLCSRSTGGADPTSWSRPATGHAGAGGSHAVAVSDRPRPCGGGVGAADRRAAAKTAVVDRPRHRVFCRASWPTKLPPRRCGASCATWAGLLDLPSARAENIAVLGSHLGFGHHAAVIWAVADRLAQPHDQVDPIPAAPRAGALYPPPDAPPKPSQRPHHGNGR
jgi:hypothetical protein